MKFLPKTLPRGDTAQECHLRIPVQIRGIGDILDQLWPLSGQIYLSTYGRDRLQDVQRQPWLLLEPETFLRVRCNWGASWLWTDLAMLQGSANNTESTVCLAFEVEKVHDEC